MNMKACFCFSVILCQAAFLVDAVHEWCYLQRGKPSGDEEFDFAKVVMAESTHPNDMLIQRASPSVTCATDNGCIGEAAEAAKFVHSCATKNMPVIVHYHSFPQFHNWLNILLKLFYTAHQDSVTPQLFVITCYYEYPNRIKAFYAADPSGSDLAHQNWEGTPNDVQKFTAWVKQVVQKPTPAKFSNQVLDVTAFVHNDILFPSITRFKRGNGDCDVVNTAVDEYFQLWSQTKSQYFSSFRSRQPVSPQILTGFIEKFLVHFDSSRQREVGTFWNDKSHSLWAPTTLTHQPTSCQLSDVLTVPLDTIYPQLKTAMQNIYKIITDEREEQRQILIKKHQQIALDNGFFVLTSQAEKLHSKLRPKATRVPR